MKVFKMNDFDHVCAESEEQAKKFYSDETGFTMEEIEEEFSGEVGLYKTMLVDLEDLPEEELKSRQILKQWAGRTWAVKPFAWVIENDKITDPCIICSTEF